MTFRFLIARSGSEFFAMRQNSLRQILASPATATALSGLGSPGQRIARPPGSRSNGLEPYHTTSVGWHIVFDLIFGAEPVGDATWPPGDGNAVENGKPEEKHEGDCPPPDGDEPGC